MITFDDFKKIDLRIAKVESVEPHPDADKLLVLQISLGSERKQLVAGLKGHYEPEELVGKLIVIVNNLEPRPLRGIESQGMLLAVQDGPNVVLITTDKETSVGTKVL